MTIWYGGCGVEFCADCLPRFDESNREIAEPVCNERGVPRSECPWYCSHGDGGWHCAHEWLARPESDTRECLICGTEATA